MIQDQRYLPPRILQVVGILLLIGFAIFWGVTGRESILLVSTAGSLILLGGSLKATAGTGKGDVKADE